MAAAPTWAELYRTLPPELRRYQLDLAWSRERLFALELPVVETPVAELRWQLGLPWWRDGDRCFAVRPTDVLADPERFAGHHERALAADLGCPIHVTPRCGRLFVLDGVHRLLKAVIVGAPTLPARRLGAEDLRRIAL